MEAISQAENDPLRSARPVFLVAADFLTGWNHTDLAGGRLVDPEVRKEHPPVATIYDERPLMIVAAGQEEGPGNPARLGPTSPHSPQNLGDLEGVLVVTACTECSPFRTRIMDRAHVPDGDNGAIQLVAPGGTAVPGWIDELHVGAAPGTSQAAAFAAGAASSMIARFPTWYSRSKNVKIRMQATAWPLVGGMGHEPNVQSKASVGLVALSMAKIGMSASLAAVTIDPIEATSV